MEVHTEKSSMVWRFLGAPHRYDKECVKEGIREIVYYI